MPLLYECQRCTACCRWPGQVKLNEAEITRIADYLGVSETDFIGRHTRLRTDRKGLSLLEKSSGECEFLVGSDCCIQPVKPQQCRDFPNLWNFPGFDQVCRAIPRNVSTDEWRRHTDTATGRDAQSGAQVV